MFTGLAQFVEHWAPKIEIMTEIVKYVKESFEELRTNVSWPGFNEGLNLTVLVAVFSIIFSLIIWGLDTVFSRIIQEFFKLIN